MTENEEYLLNFARSLKLKSTDELFYFPKFVQIETVSSCNARCVMCPIEDWKRDVQRMTPELFQKITDELQNYTGWIDKLTIQLDGEPLLDKKLEDRIRILKKIGIRYIAFSSNASLMTEDRSRSILGSGLDEISYSMDGVTKETFEKIRVRLKYDECVQNIVRFLQIRNETESKTKVRIRMTIQEANVHEFKEFCHFWSEHLRTQDCVYGKLIHNWAQWVQDYKLPGGGESPEVLNNQPCISPWGTLIILTDGRVPLCCSDYNAKVEIGNVRRNTIKELWQNQVSRKVRAAHASEGRKSMDICKDCNIWDPKSRIDPNHEGNLL